MTVTITAIRGAGGGCNHLHVDFTIDGGPSRTIAVDRDDLRQERAAMDAEDLVDAIRHIIRNEGLATPAQIRSALVGRQIKL